MAYFYVSTGGGVTGTRAISGGDTQRTGAFSAMAASDVYATIASAIDTGLATSGDIICVSDAHAYSVAAHLNYFGPLSGDFLTITTVSDTACETSTIATAAQEFCTANNTASFRGRISAFGLWVKSNNDVGLGVSGTSLQMQNCIWEVTGSGDVFLYTSVDGAFMRAVDCEFKGITGSLMRISNGSKVVWEGCTTTGIDTLLSSSIGIGGGGHFTAIGCDLSSVTGSLWANGGNAADSDDVIQVEYRGCKLPATEPAFVTETLASQACRLRMSNTSGSAAVAEYQFNETSFGGQVNQDDAIYRDGSTAFPSGAKISLACATLTTATKATPFWFDFPTRYAELSNAASDTLRIYLVSSATLYDSDVWAEVSYPDGTTKQLYNFLSTRHTNILDTNGTELTTNTEAWTNPPATPNYYQIDIPITDGSDCYPTIRMYVAKPSATIYFCPVVEIV